MNEFMCDLEKANDKLSMFSLESLKKYNMTNKDLIDAVNNNLTDEEKLRLFNEYPHFRNIKFPYIKIRIIESVKDDNVLLELINNEAITHDFNKYDLLNIISSASENVKEELLNNYNFLRTRKFEAYEIQKLVLSLDNEAKKKILDNTDYVKNTLKLEEYHIAGIIKSLPSDEEKINIVDKYNFSSSNRVSIVSSYSERGKVEEILNSDKYNKIEEISILKTLEYDTLNKLILENKEHFKSKEIYPYEIISELDSNKQKMFAENIDKLDISLNQKREIFALLNDDVKENIDIEKLDDNLKSALKMKKKGNYIVYDDTKDIEEYRGLDRLLRVDPEYFNEKEREKFLKLCDICPDMGVINGLGNGKSDIYLSCSSAEEYKKGEEWLNSIISSIPKDYTNIQKVAIIDNAIGKRISYSPDYGTEVSDIEDCRSLWKIIDRGYGVCNGVAKVEQYALKRAGVESEIVDTESHSFLKLNDIEIPTEEGLKRGNTILDPTWNLTNHRFGARPNNFCLSYENIRKNDVDVLGVDHECHKNDEKLKDATLNLDDKYLREVFKSVGLLRDDNSFPIKYMIDKSDEIDKRYKDEPKKNIEEQFKLLKEVCPEFATCQNSSTEFLKDVLLNHKNIGFDKCTVSRVYNKNDKDKKPVLYVYLNNKNNDSLFYYADSNKNSFIQKEKDEFIREFECYDKDLEKKHMIRPWESLEELKEEIDLSINSGKVIEKEKIKHENDR